MKKTLKQGFFIFLALGLMMGMIADACIVMNDVVCAFSPTAEKSSIEDNIIAGATYFLASKANADLLLMEYEKASNQKLDMASSLSCATAAIGKLETAREKYILARDIGKRIGYIEYKCAWFKNFDYDRFINERNLIPSIADKVRGYLNNMDIVGLYTENINNIEAILKTLKEIEGNLKQNRKPAIGLIWGLLRQYSGAALFGNYATLLGTEVLKSGSGIDDGPPICEID
jgi:hypothetical protein